MSHESRADEPIAALSIAIGNRVRYERRRREWTLDQLAEASGVSRRLLVGMEQGKANPGVGTLLKIAGALGIGLPSLVTPTPQASRDLAVTREGGGSVLWRGDHGGRGTLLIGQVSPSTIELWDWTLGPGDRHTSEAHVSGAQEFLVVNAGEIDVTVGAEIVSLVTGDALAFPADQPHSYANHGPNLARFTLTVYEPAAHTNRPEED